MPSITINGITVDTDEHAAEVHSLGLQPEQPPQFDHILIHTEAPLTTEQREQVAAVGAEVQEYVSPNTYLASYTPTDISAVTALPFVDWADEYLNVFKIPPTLLDSNVDSSSVRSLLRVYADRAVQDEAEALIAIAEHDAVFRAIAAGDEDAAASAMATHMATASQRLAAEATN